MGCKWQHASLGDICRLVGGSAFPRRYQGQSEGVPFIKVSDMNLSSNGWMICKASNHVNEKVLVDIGAKKQPRGATVFAKIGEALKADRTRMLTTETAIDNNMMAAIPKSGTDKWFLYYLISWLRLSNYAEGSALPYLKQSTLNKIPITLPNSEVAQRKVVEILYELDSQIKLNTAQNGYLHDLVMAASKSIYQEIETTDAPLPDGWRWVEVEEIAELVSRGITPKYDESSAETVLGQTCVRNNLVFIENGRHHKPKKINEKWLREGDLLINSTGVGSLGRTAQVWFEPEKLTVDSHITIVRTRKPEHALYLGFWAFAHERYIESLHTGSTGQTELPRDHVKAIRFVLPDAVTLSWFNSIAEPAVKAIVANQVESKKLEALRDALLPKLMSGEIDVSKVEVPTPPNSHLYWS